ncbi:MAG: AAA family ATPase [Rickettsiales bacterium]|nr:AAA family ATPase [Rickettsiales bacterium]
MKEILILKDNFDELQKLSDFLDTKNIKTSVISINEDKNLEKNKSTLICSKKFQSEIGGKSELLKISRNIGSTNLIVLDSTDKNEFSINEDLGGAYLEIVFTEIDEVVREIIFQILTTENFSFSDSKTHSLVKMAKKVAQTDVTVFIYGPTGTGKEVISNFIHQNSVRADKPFVAINCAAIPENMLEAMLFGHEKGAFTGASSANKGIFRAADTGTLLLDEISEMPLPLQAKLLRVLQEKKVTPIGGQRDIDVDVRVIATTNRNMIEEVREKKFREDLYYRLNVFPIETCNLSERPNDIIPISIALLKRHSGITKLPFITNKARKLLKDYNWPGNVRELENVLQRAIVLCDGGTIDEKDIMIDINSGNNFYENLDDVKEIKQAVI